VWSSLELPYADRYTDPVTSAIILASGVIHHSVICIAVLLRAERREPFLLVSVIGGLVTALGIWLSAHYGTMRTVAITNFMLTFVGLPVAYALYAQRRRVWKERSTTT
jgi:drug/metabolite transporter (DMT)-like permease